MRDQPFKKHFPLDKAKSKQSYRYPTYQHYYESKVSRLNVKVSPKKQMPFHSQKKVSQTETPTEVITPGLVKTTSKTNLKTQLENLKLQVQRIMQKKQGILKTVQKKHHHSTQKINIDMINDSPRKSEPDDNLSVNSYNLINEPLKKLELRRSTQNYDHQKYLELQRDLLKTQLRNLKNKYNDKKKELTEKCQLLEKKVVFLQTSLYNSQKSLESEIATLRQSLNNVQKEGVKQLIPTSDKVKSLSELSPKKESNVHQQTQILREKLKKLYDQLSLKNKHIYQKDQRIEQLQSDISKIKKQTSFGYQKSKSLQRQAEELKKIYNSTIQRLNQKQMRIQELQQALQNQRGNKFYQNNNSLNLFEEKLDNLKKQYQSKLKINNAELQQVLSENKKNQQQKMILQQQLSFLKAQNQQNLHRIQVLSAKLKEEKANSQQTEEKYLKILEKNQKKHEQILANIHREYQSKVNVLSKKDSRSAKDENNQRSSDKKGPYPNQTNLAQQKQVRKWKLQYKQLKQKYEQHLRTQANKKAEIKQSYKSYRQNKQKVEVYAHKLKLFQKQFEKYLSILTEKQNQLLQKQIQLRTLKNDNQLQKNVYTHQNQALTQKCKSLEQKLNEQTQKYESQLKYRKELEEKIVTSGISEQSLKEMMERMKKRLIEQDQKFSKIIKQNKNKESLNTKLKQQLREVMENLEKKILKQKAEEIKQITQTYLKKQLDSFKQWKNRSEEQHKLAQQSNQKLIKQIEQLKNTVIQKDQTLNFCQKELNIVRHNYNLKNIEVEQLIRERERMFNHFNQQLEQTNQMRISIQKIFQDEIMMKNQEITSLRAEVAAKNINTFQHKYYNTTFDDILKNNIEENKKLRDDITKKTEEIFRLRDNYSTLRSQYENLKAQIQINKLKTMSEKKNMEVNFQIENQNIKNELDMSEKKVISLEQKIKILIEQNKKKDSFIQTYIVGKKLAPNDKDLVTNFIKQYEITVGSSDIVNRLASQTKEIQRLSLYNHNLLKEISVLRQKLLAYQAIDQEKVSVFDSKVSKYSINSSEIKEELNEDINFQLQKKKEKTNDSKLRKTQSLQEFVAIEHEF